MRGRKSVKKRKTMRSELRHKAYWSFLRRMTIMSRMSSSISKEYLCGQDSIDAHILLKPSVFCVCRGSALQRRLADREVEKAADERDRQKEIEQLEAARRKLFEEDAPDAESIILLMEQSMQEHLLKRLDLNATSPQRRKRRGDRPKRDSSGSKPSSRSVSKENSPDPRRDKPNTTANAPTSGFVDACLVEVTISPEASFYT